MNHLHPVIRKKYKRKKKPPRWLNLLPPYEVGKDDFTYKNVVKDTDGWADALVYKPLPYDLVNVKIINIIKSGWWDGSKWEGYRIKEDDIVLFWKLELQGYTYGAA